MTVDTQPEDARLTCSSVPCKVMQARSSRETKSEESQERIRKALDFRRELLRTYPHSKRVGDYLIGKTLGEGSFAKVKEALHTLTGQKVAVKIIDKRKVKADAYIRKNLKRETRLLQMFRHPNIIKLYETMETEHSYYIVTELCEGGELIDRICSKRALDEQEVRKYIKQILSAVYYLHSAGVLHRDLKIENLLFDENVNIKIIDFGLSNSVKVTKTPGGEHRIDELLVTQCGSPAYAAPELLAHQKYGPSVDVWSIGVNMYAMLTGNLPYTVDPFHIKSLLNKMLKGDMNPMPAHASINCRDLLRKLLNPVPEARISVKEAMEHPWITTGPCGSIQKVAFPNRLPADSLHGDVLDYMSKELQFKVGDIIRNVVGNMPSSVCSTYHLLLKRLNAYRTELKVSGTVPASKSGIIVNNKKDEYYIPRRIDVKVFPKSENSPRSHWTSARNNRLQKKSSACINRQDNAKPVVSPALPSSCDCNDPAAIIAPILGKTTDSTKSAKNGFDTKTCPSEVANPKNDGSKSNERGKQSLNTSDSENELTPETRINDGSPIKKVVIHRRQHQLTGIQRAAHNKQRKRDSRELPLIPVAYNNLNRACTKQELVKLSGDHVSSSEETKPQDDNGILPIKDLCCTNPKLALFRPVEPSHCRRNSPSRLSTSPNRPTQRQIGFSCLYSWKVAKKTRVNLTDLNIVIGSNTASKRKSAILKKQNTSLRKSVDVGNISSGKSAEHQVGRGHNTPLTGPLVEHNKAT